MSLVPPLSSPASPVGPASPFYPNPVHSELRTMSIRFNWSFRFPMLKNLTLRLHSFQRDFRNRLYFVPTESDAVVRYRFTWILDHF